MIKQYKSGNTEITIDIGQIKYISIGNKGILFREPYLILFDYKGNSITHYMNKANANLIYENISADLLKLKK